jgi:hypothetical protein
VAGHFAGRGRGSRTCVEALDIHSATALRSHVAGSPKMLGVDAVPADVILVDPDWLLFACRSLRFADSVSANKSISLIWPGRIRRYAIIAGCGRAAPPRFGRFFRSQLDVRHLGCPSIHAQRVPDLSLVPSRQYAERHRGYRESLDALIGSPRRLRDNVTSALDGESRRGDAHCFKARAGYASGWRW